MTKLSPFLMACGICMLAATSLNAAQPVDRGPTPGLGWGPGGKAKSSYAVPAPVAGVGLPVLVAVGGYLWIRRRTRQQK